MNYYDYLMLSKKLPNNNELKQMIYNSRCSKCVYEGECHSFDTGDCKHYKRDPPDGGYYG